MCLFLKLPNKIIVVSYVFWLICLFNSKKIGQCIRECPTRSQNVIGCSYLSTCKHNTGGPSSSRVNTLILCTLCQLLFGSSKLNVCKACDLSISDMINFLSEDREHYEAGHLPGCTAEVPQKSYAKQEDYQFSVVT